MQAPGKVLITGATGFIGSHLTRKLIHESLQVGVVKRSDSNMWRLEDVLSGVRCFNVDLRSPEQVSKVISAYKPDIVFHLAACQSVDDKPEEMALVVETNVLATRNLLDACKDTGVRLFVNTSSFFVYKESEGKVSEVADLAPRNLYALSKAQVEEACQFYAENYGLTSVTFRIFAPYGPADHERRLIPYVIRCLSRDERPKLTSGEQRWDFVYVEDVVEAYAKLLRLPPSVGKHEVFNIGTGVAFSVREIVYRTIDIMGSSIEPEWGAVPHRRSEVWFACADTTKIHNRMGWAPSIRIMEEGLPRTIGWYRKHWEFE